MYIVNSIIDGSKYQYIKGEFETVQAAREYLNQKKEEFGFKKFELLTKSKKGFSHYINKYETEIFTNPNFILHITPGDWEIIWIVGPTVNGFSEAKSTGMVQIEDVKKYKQLNLNKLATEQKLKSFYHLSWRDEYFTDEFSEPGNPGEPLSKELMSSIREDMQYIELTVEKPSKEGNILSIFIDSNIASDVEIVFSRVSEFQGLRCYLKYKNTYIYGTGGYGLEILEIIQLLHQWKFKIQNGIFDKIEKAMMNIGTEDNWVDIEDIKNRIDLFKEAVEYNANRT